MSYGERAAQFRDAISPPIPDLLGGWVAGWRPHLEVKAAHEHLLGLAEAVDAPREPRLPARGLDINRQPTPTVASEDAWCARGPGFGEARRRFVFHVQEPLWIIVWVCRFCVSECVL